MRVTLTRLLTAHLRAANAGCVCLLSVLALLMPPNESSTQPLRSVPATCHRAHGGQRQASERCAVVTFLATAETRRPGHAEPPPAGGAAPAVAERRGRCSYAPDGAVRVV